MLIFSAGIRISEEADQEGKQPGKGAAGAEEHSSRTPCPQHMGVQHVKAPQKKQGFPPESDQLRGPALPELFGLHQTVVKRPIATIKIGREKIYHKTLRVTYKGLHSSWQHSSVTVLSRISFPTLAALAKITRRQALEHLLPAPLRSHLPSHLHYNLFSPQGLLFPEVFLPTL